MAGYLAHTCELFIMHKCRPAAEMKLQSGLVYGPGLKATKSLFDPPRSKLHQSIIRIGKLMQNHTVGRIRVDLGPGLG
jgi:hypothetical protein